MAERLGFDAGFFLDFAEGGLEEGLASLDLAFGKVPATIALDEEHGAVGSGDDAAGSADPLHAAFHVPQQAEGNVESVIFIAKFHCRKV